MTFYWPLWQKTILVWAKVCYTPVGRQGCSWKTGTIFLWLKTVYSCLPSRKHTFQRSFVCTDLFSPTFILSRTKWEVLVQSAVALSHSPHTRALPSRHWRKDAQEHTRLVTETPLSWAILLHPSFWSCNTSPWDGKQPHTKPTSLHSCTRNAALNSFHQDTVSVHHVTLWAELPVICERCRQICWKLYVDRHNPDFCVFCKLWSWGKRVLYFPLTQRVLCLARPLARVSQTQQPRIQTEKEPSVSHRSTSCFVRPEAWVFCCHAVSTVRTKDRKSQKFFPSFSFFPPAGGQHTHSSLHCLLPWIHSNSTYKKATSVKQLSVLSSHLTAWLQQPAWHDWASGSRAKALKRVKANACTLLPVFLRSMHLK